MFMSGNSSSVGTDHRITSAYHPQSNGLVERLNQTLQNTLVKQVNDHQSNWDVFLDPALFAIRTSKQKSTKYTPFELMFNRYAIIHVQYTQTYANKYKAYFSHITPNKYCMFSKLQWLFGFSSYITFLPSIHEPLYTCKL